MVSIRKVFIGKKNYDMMADEPTSSLETVLLANDSKILTLTNDQVELWENCTKLNHEKLDATEKRFGSFYSVLRPQL